MLYIETESNGTRYFHGVTYNSTRGSFRCFRTFFQKALKQTILNKFATLKPRRKPGPSKLSQRILGLLLGVGKKWPIADRRVPSNDP